MAKTLPKKKTPETVVAVTTFAMQNRLVRRGDKFAGDDPLVLTNPSWFADINTPTDELPNMCNEMPPPPQHEPSPGFDVTVQSILIPPHRRVRSRVDMWTPGRWAPGSPGEKRGGPPPVGSALRVGQILDIGDPRVRANPGHFEFVARDVTLEDVERLTSEET